MRFFSTTKHPRVRLVAEAIVAALGVACLVWAWRADLRWCERHTMITYWAFCDEQKETAHRWRMAGLGAGLVTLLVVRPLVGVWAGKRTGRSALGACARFGVAIALSFVASEIGLRMLKLPRPMQKPAHWPEVQMGEHDARYGWTWIPSQSREVAVGGRTVHYDFNAEKNRARNQSDLPDHSIPTILLTGESVAMGHGLEWDETYAAIAGNATGLQVVNFAVHGYGNDQAFLRVADALPTFKQPVAIVTLYMPSLIYRVSEPDHPHLTFDGDAFDVSSGGFFDHLNLGRAWRNVVGYHTDADLELVGKIFKETDRLARARGAKAIFVGPHFGDARGDQYVIDELFVSQGLTFVDIDIGPDKIPDDIHPTAGAIRKLADALIDALRAAGVATR